MSARKQAVQDMMPELKKSNKSFIVFRRELNPIMKELVAQQIREQENITLFPTPSHTNSQLIARCFFAKGEVQYENYDKYYQNQEEQHIIDQIEADADY